MRITQFNVIAETESESAKKKIPKHDWNPNSVGVKKIREFSGKYNKFSEKI
jgi:hypothetical protein